MYSLFLPSYLSVWPTLVQVWLIFIIHIEHVDHQCGYDPEWYDDRGDVAEKHDEYAREEVTQEILFVVGI